MRVKVNRTQHRYVWRGRRFSVRRLLRIGEVVSESLNFYTQDGHKLGFSIGAPVGLYFVQPERG